MRNGLPQEAVAFLHHRDGHRVPVVVRAAALRDPDGRITAAVEVFHDDTRARGLAERLDSAQRETLTDTLTEVASRRMLPGTAPTP